MENHNQHGKSHTDSNSVGKAQEESGEEADEPDQLWKEKSTVGHFTVSRAGAQRGRDAGILHPKNYTAEDQKTQDLNSAAILIRRFIACFGVKHQCWEACQKPQLFSCKSSQCVSSQQRGHSHRSERISLSSREKAFSNQTICCSESAPSAPQKAPAASQRISEGMDVSENHLSTYC